MLGEGTPSEAVPAGSAKEGANILSIINFSSRFPHIFIFSLISLIFASFLPKT
jgi:hypothetical protein